MKSNRNIFSAYDVDKVEEFEWWFYDNVESYRAIQDCITIYGRVAKKKFSLRMVLEMLRAGIDIRWRHIEVSLNNDFIPMLQRRLEMDRPDLMEYLTAIRKSHTKKGGLE